MTDSNRNLPNHCDWKSERWRSYQQMELIPNSILPVQQVRFAFGLDFLWRGLLNLLADELVYEQQIEYLNRCWANHEAAQDSTPKTLQQLWILME